ncbi:hypothetical protein FHS85_004921 [Rhodoligotrophos appendicifer]|uniref:hypothetical protein n=1 Tax=Rhodoligotrophos appendicifer TaxID=987056 RepID=UPI001184E6F6|nr:hypothetical protein [Rhodoligotrophos appendicifer]
MMISPQMLNAHATLTKTAEIAGAPLGTISQWVNKGLLGGPRALVGTEHRFDLGDVMMITLFAAMNRNERPRKELMEAAAGLIPTAIEIIRAAGPDQANVYAVELSGRSEPDKARYARHVVHGEPGLSSLVNEAAQKGWPEIRVLNLSAIVATVLQGWIAATADTAALEQAL